MPNREILQLGNPALYKESARVGDVRSTEIEGIVRDLSDTLAVIPRSYRIRTRDRRPADWNTQAGDFHPNAAGGVCGALINPEIVWASDGRFELWDDCFSFPDLMVRVSRARRFASIIRTTGD